MANEAPGHSAKMYFSGSLGVLFSRSVGMIAGVGSLWFLTRVLSTEDFAAYTFAMSLIFVLGFAASLGLERVMLLRISPLMPEPGILKGGMLARRIVVRVGLLSLVVAAGCAALLYAFPVLSAQNDLLGWFKSLVPIVPAVALTTALIAWLQSNHVVGRPQAVHGQIDGLRCLGFAVVFAVGLGSWAVALAAVLASLLPPLWLAWRSAQPVQPEPSAFSLADVGDGLNFFVMRLSTIGFMHADILILGVMAPPEVVAPYVVASRFAMILEAGQQIFAPAYTPRVRQHIEAGQPALAAREYRVARILGFLAAGTAALGFVVLGPLLLSFFGEFQSVFGVLMIMCAGYVLLVGAGLHSVHMSMSGRLRMAMRVQLAGLVIYLGLLALWVPQHGIWGAALAFLVAQVVLAGLGLWLLHKHSGIIALGWFSAGCYLSAVGALICAGLWPEARWFAAAALTLTLGAAIWRDAGLIRTVIAEGLGQLRKP